MIYCFIVSPDLFSLSEATLEVDFNSDCYLLLFQISIKPKLYEKKDGLSGFIQQIFGENGKK